ncbi:hypothetical protein GCM10011352_39150 [Marinobacterium zhoushanense]|uniref:Restriction endonuclease n=1 Tax=Marinobacterium zhoushanense TaxID=1679163 RepID=A0ABQ1KUW2_9GAMM|nr:type II restriction endonuclease [Marinobacterium zhoushanense]GGC08950.1 hypothetical protein GCM10011352_39150 [Marinobacterium zhoushanense]
MNEASFIQALALKYDISPEITLYKYLERKTKASDRGSKARRSLGNLYALYVICEDYRDNKEGSSFSELMVRMRALPFGSKLQNHPLDNRLNDEVRRQYGVSDEMLPVQNAQLNGRKKARKVSELLLKEKGSNPLSVSKFVVDVIDTYVRIIETNQNEYLEEIEDAQSRSNIVSVVEKAFEKNSDARLFEIVSYSIMHHWYAQKTIEYTFEGKLYKENLSLYRTGRTNANDGGIDFVLKPFGRFFQVTETLDFKKYFLDFDKTNKFPISFVIKTELDKNSVMKLVREASVKEIGQDKADQYCQLFEEIFTLNELSSILNWIGESEELLKQLQKTIIESFKLEYGLLD